jgi:hypothetical protein
MPVKGDPSCLFLKLVPGGSATVRVPSGPIEKISSTASSGGFADAKVRDLPLVCISVPER